MVAFGSNEMWARQRRPYRDRRLRQKRDEDEDGALEVEDVEDDDSDDEEEDDDDDDGQQPLSQTVASASSTSTETFLPPPTTPPALEPTTSPTPPLETPTPFITSYSSEPISTVFLTSSSVSTMTVSASATAETALAESSPTNSSSTIVIGQEQDGNGVGDGGYHPPPPHNNNRFAIAFGVIGAVGFLVGLIWAALMIRRRRRRKNQDHTDVHDYASTIGRPGRSCKFPSLPFSLPFGRSSSSLSINTNGGGSPRRTLALPFSSKVKRSDASIMDEAIRAAYGTDSDPVPKGFLDEKRHDPNYPLPLLEPEPVPQASIRQSIVRWFKRSSGHHPLKLNPMSRWSRSTRASTLTYNKRTSSMYSVPIYLANQDDFSSMRSSVPPVPPLNIQRQATGASNNGVAVATPTAAEAPTPVAVPSELPAAPMPAFTRDDAQAYYKTMWASESERTSVASSWTDVTRSTMRVSTGPTTAGLSPPPSYSNRDTLVTDPDTSSLGGATPKEGLYILYSRDEKTAAAETVGLGLQRFDTMGQR